jgi:hypothetical protein
MALILGGICVSMLCLSTVIWIKRTTGRREMEPHSITADGLHALLATNHEVLLFGVGLGASAGGEARVEASY